MTKSPGKGVRDSYICKTDIKWVFCAKNGCRTPKVANGKRNVA